MGKVDNPDSRTTATKWFFEEPSDLKQLVKERLQVEGTKIGKLIPRENKKISQENKVLLCFTTRT